MLTNSKMAFIWNSIWHASFFNIIFFILLAYVPHQFFPELNFEPQAYDHPNYTEIIKPELVNFDAFANASEYLFENQLIGAEAFEFHDNYAYSGLADGQIIRFNYKDSNPKLETFIRVHKQTPEFCDHKYYRIQDCGRTLGLKIRDGILYTVNTQFGLTKINLQTKKISQISMNIPFDKKTRVIMPNSLVFDPKRPNIVYLTVSSTRWNVDQVPYSLLEHENTGKLISLNLKTHDVTTLVDNLYFANGLALSSDKKYFYIAQSTNFSVIRVALDSIHNALDKGEEVKVEKFFETLPGEPDNLVVSNGKVYVGFALARIDSKLLISDVVSSFPRVRLAFGRYAHLLHKILHHIQKWYSNEFLEWINFNLYSMYFSYELVPKKSAFGILNEKTGKLEKLYASENANFFSEAIPIPGTNQILIGSFRNKFVIKTTI